MSKSKSVIVSVVISSLILFAGCAKCPTAEKQADLAPGVDLPRGFAVLKGLTDEDYGPTGWPKYIVSTKDGSIMTLVNATDFMMGAFGQDRNEKPVHAVKVGMYYIDVYETDNVQFARFAREVQCLIPLVSKDHPYLADTLLSNQTPQCWIKRNWDPSYAECIQSNPSSTPAHVQMEVDYFKNYWKPGVNDSHPARAVSFWEAWYYCRWVGKDLPTEAEWELAAKGNDNRIYPWGNIEPDSQKPLCNYGGEKPSEDGYEYTAPVSAFAAGRSPFGCYNMSGNVWEWCKDNYDTTAYSAPKSVNPKGPSLGDKRVIRGGAFTSNIYSCRTTAREMVKPNVHSNNIGFRGVLRIR